MTSQAGNMFGQSVMAEIKVSRTAFVIAPSHLYGFFVLSYPYGILAHDMITHTCHTSSSW